MKKFYFHKKTNPKWDLPFPFPPFFQGSYSPLGIEPLSFFLLRLCNLMEQQRQLFFLSLRERACNDQMQCPMDLFIPLSLVEQGGVKQLDWKKVTTSLSTSSKKAKPLFNVVKPDNFLLPKTLLSDSECNKYSTIRKVLDLFFLKKKESGIALG